MKSWGGGGEQNQEEAKCRRKQDRGRSQGEKEGERGEMGAGNRGERGGRAEGEGFRVICSSSAPKLGRGFSAYYVYHTLLSADFHA